MYSLLKKVNQILNKEIKRITSNNAEKGTEEKYVDKKVKLNSTSFLFDYYFFFKTKRYRMINLCNPLFSTLKS